MHLHLRHVCLCIDFVSFEQIFCGKVNHTGCQLLFVSCQAPAEYSLNWLSIHLLGKQLDTQVAIGHPNDKQIKNK